MIRSYPKPNVPTPLRRSDRVPHQPDRYYSFLVRNDDPIEFHENNEDPITYMDAMQRSDSDKWLEAMKSEMESMKVNDVWILVDPPEGVKPIGCSGSSKGRGAQTERWRPIKPIWLPRDIINVLV